MNRQNYSRTSWLMFLRSNIFRRAQIIICRCFLDVPSTHPTGESGYQQVCPRHQWADSHTEFVADAEAASSLGCKYCIVIHDDHRASAHRFVLPCLLWIERHVSCCVCSAVSRGNLFQNATRESFDGQGQFVHVSVSDNVVERMCPMFMRFMMAYRAERIEVVVPQQVRVKEHCENKPSALCHRRSVRIRRYYKTAPSYNLCALCLVVFDGGAFVHGKQHVFFVRRTHGHSERICR